MTASIRGPRPASVTLLVSAIALVPACASGATASDAVDQAETDLAQLLTEAHERALEQRAADPAAVDATTTELQGLRSPVPRPGADPCSSGSGDCVGG